jgi:hypothetical protein
MDDALGKFAPLTEAAIERRVAELSTLTEIKYALERLSAAQELSISVGILDKLVKARRPTDGTGQGRAITFPVIEPWPSPVDGPAMLKELVAAQRRYVSPRACRPSLWRCGSSSRTSTTPSMYRRVSS